MGYSGADNTIYVVAITSIGGFMKTFVIIMVILLAYMVYNGYRTDKMVDQYARTRGIK